jgi:surface polysaccharide O-acyltransferase-like enzyme
VKSGFKYSIENFRGLSIIFVVFSHFGSFHELGLVGQFLYFLVVNATAWFVFLSGYLFYYIEQPRFNYLDYLKKKAKYVVLPYLVLSVPAILAGIYLSRPQLLGLTRAGYVGWSLVVGGGTVVGPMWFIPMIVLFFLVSPFFSRLADSRWMYLVSAVGMILSIFTWRPIGSLNPFLSFLHFLGFYLLGISFAVAAPKLDSMRRASKTVLIVAGLLGFSITYSCGYSEDRIFAFMDGMGVFNPLQFGKLCLLVPLFFLFERFVSSKNRLLAYFASISFGLFFIHGFYMAIYSRVINSSGIEAPILKFLGEVSVVFGLSLATVAIIKFVLGQRSRYVIGC